MIKLKKILAKQNSRTCSSCSYYRNGYCNDLDKRVSPDEIGCSDNNYYA